MVLGRKEAYKAPQTIDLPIDNHLISLNKSIKVKTSKVYKFITQRVNNHHLKTTEELL